MVHNAETGAHGWVHFESTGVPPMCEQSKQREAICSGSARASFSDAHEGS